MLKPFPLSLADWRSVPKTVFVVVWCVVAFIAFLNDAGCEVGDVVYVVVYVWRCAPYLWPRV